MTSPQLYLKFDDWVKSNSHLNKDWIVVSRFDSSLPDSFGTFSVLIPNNQKDIDSILSNWSWDASSDFGKPFFSKDFRSEKISFNLGSNKVENDVPIEPFTVLQEFYSAAPSRVDVVQNFVLYHNLYFDFDKKQYVEPISDQSVIRYLNDPCFITIKTSFLRDYLAARNMALLRLHDHRRLVKKSIDDLFGKKREDIQIEDNDRHFMIMIVPGVDRNVETMSRLLGKDIIYPFNEPIHPDYQLLAEKEDKKYQSFIVDIDEKGKEVEKTCNENELSVGEFLTPVFFKKQVLKKYYDNSRRYTVEVGYLKSLGLWGIPYGINDEGLVHVWLGDLGRIPYKEQLNFRQYNVFSTSKLGKEFYQTEILAKFVETKDPIYTLKQLRNQINGLCQTKLGFQFFKELSEMDYYIYKNIHIPTTSEFRELDEQLIFLAKLLCDSINKSELESRVTWKPTTDENTKIRFVEKFLEEQFGLTTTLSEQIAKPFRHAQKLRSESAAHRKSSQFEKTLIKLGLNRRDSEEIFRFLVSSLIVKMEKIVKLFEQL